MSHGDWVYQDNEGREIGLCRNPQHVERGPHRHGDEPVIQYSAAERPEKVSSNMSMSTHVVGLRSADDPTYRQMVQVVEACAAANVEVPASVTEYFGPDARGCGAATLVQYHLEAPLQVPLPATPWRENMGEGMEIRVSAIPAGVSVIRFYNLY
jgi:hypothetical protein